jgi:hypothetical protein
VTGAILFFAAFLGGVLLLIMALLVWQQARARPTYQPLEYVVEHAVLHILERLPEGVRLNRADVRRILDYELHYLQGLAQDDRRNPVDTIAGGHDASIQWIQSEIQSKHGVTYSFDDIATVLALEADYLVAIGAVGDPVANQGEEEE